jgi:hypothetical protein
MSKSKKRFVLVRTTNAGVFAGTLESAEGVDVVLAKARRCWYWSGAASLSELAVKGTNQPTQCKFPVAVERIHLFGVIEIIDVSDDAQASIQGVPVWTAKK